MYAVKDCGRVLLTIDSYSIGMCVIVGYVFHCSIRLLRQRLPMYTQFDQECLGWYVRSEMVQAEYMRFNKSLSLLSILLPKVDPNSLSSRPSSSCVTFLTWSGHRPVTSLAWSKDGMTLFSASPCDSRVISWDVSRVDGLPPPLTAITGY